MKWKKLLYTVLSVVLVSIYSLIKQNFPEFPLQDSEFINFVLWVVGLALGGWGIETLWKTRKQL